MRNSLLSSLILFLAAAASAFAQRSGPMLVEAGSAKPISFAPAERPTTHERVSGPVTAAEMSFNEEGTPEQSPPVSINDNSHEPALSGQPIITVEPQNPTAPATLNDGTYGPAIPGQPIITAEPRHPTAGLGDSAADETGLPAGSHSFSGVTDELPDLYRWWFHGEYLLWWMKDSHFPALVTAGSVRSGGIIGGDGTVVLYGGDIDNEARSGARFSLGTWLDCDDTLGVEGSVLFLASHSVSFTAGSSGAPGTEVIARPFFNLDRSAEDAQLVAFPGVLAGRVDVTSSSRLGGAEINGLANLHNCCQGRLDLLAGFRYFQLDEGLGISEDLLATSGTAFHVADQFDTHNRFYGGQVGARAELRRGCASASVVTKLAVGGNAQVIGANGTTLITPAVAATNAQAGGLLALASNSGHFERGEFAVLPEVGFNLGFQLSKHLRANLGYSFLYLSDAVRPGDQIDRGLNTAQVPALGLAAAPSGAGRPVVLFNEKDFWTQGLNLGFEVRY